MADAGASAAETEAAKRRKAEKEAQKAAKAAKLAEKKAKQATQSAPNPAKQAEKKAKAQTVKWEDPTPLGDKKILGSLDDPAHSAYISSVVESSWNAWWEKSGFFKPEFENGKPKKRGTFVIPIPPPNVTGALHCGHALGTALQDLMVRWERMRGFTTLYLPGCDHASISTQAVVENMLWRREGKTRHDLGRQEFLKRALDWKNEYAAKINNSLRRLGGSFDWTREAYTMDPSLTGAVMEAFVRLHEEGLIYRSNRLVNWCTKLNTAISNIEVDNKDLKGRTLLDVPGYDKKVEFGVIVHFKYQVDGTEEFIEVATTRPETMLGDTGIAVHPNDERYKHLVGKKAKHPFVDRLMPIVADNYVDPEFGTGAVKITPAHDPNDYALGGRQNLEFINILNDDGTLNSNAGSFAGQKRFDARYTVVAELEKLGLYVKKEPNPMKVPLCSKSKDVIEPLMKPQWWMKTREVADEAIKVVKNGEIKIRPENSEKNYYRWLENINDWCLSRQLWWGHQVPAWTVHIEGEPSETEEWIVARNEDEAQEKAAAKFRGKKFTLKQDPDVLDTWFSSGLWPFATLGWPKQTHDLENLFPTNVLETGWDILFFWVARMIMLSLRLTGKIPFKEVYCHSLIRDSEGRKMSKSLGNVIDPLDVMEGITLEALNAKLTAGNLDPKELASATKYQKTSFPQGMPECGADAVRFTLIQYTTGGGDIPLDIKVIAANRRFCNKIYQATKYVLGKLPENFTPRKDSSLSGNETLAEKWILHNLTVAEREVNKAIGGRDFSRSTQVVYSYWYEQLCDVFIENSKTIIQDGTEQEKESAINTLYTALEGGLAMLHPFMPFVSEELWQRLPRRPGDKTPSIVLAAYPEDLPFENPTAAAEYGLVLRCSKGIRSLAAEYNIKEGGVAFIQGTTGDASKGAQAELPAIKSLIGKNIAKLTVLGPDDTVPTGCAVYVASTALTIFLEVRGRVSVDELITSAKTKQAKADETVRKQKALIGAPDFAEKVSEAVRELEEAKLREAEAEERSFQASIEQFEKLKLEDA